MRLLPAEAVTDGFRYPYDPIVTPGVACRPSSGRLVTMLTAPPRLPWLRRSKGPLATSTRSTSAKST